jgi:putative membrane protein
MTVPTMIPALPDERQRRARIALLGLPALAVCALVVDGLAPLSRHMALHIVVMNMLAPLVVLSVQSPRYFSPRTHLGAATGVQLAALCLLHTPALMHASMHNAVTAALSHGLLFGTAVYFWRAVLTQHPAHRWCAILALLVTGKIFCMVGVLLVFAPHALYALAHTADSTTDQRLAGLLMLIACPLSYIGAAVLLTIRWLGELTATPSSLSGRIA